MTTNTTTAPNDPEQALSTLESQTITAGHGDVRSMGELYPTEFSAIRAALGSEPVDMIESDRGLLYGEEIPSSYGGNVSVYESSHVIPHIWLKVVCPENLNEPTGPTVEAVAHLPIAEAAKLRDHLIYLLKRRPLAVAPTETDQ